MRIMLTLRGRIIRDEQFSSIDEREIKKALNRAIRDAMKTEKGPRDALEFSLVIFGGTNG